MHVYHLCTVLFWFGFFLTSVWKVCHVTGSGAVGTCFFLFGSWVMRSDQRDLTPSRAQSSQSERWLLGRVQKGARLRLHRRPLQNAKWARAWSSTRPVRLITFVSEEAAVGSTQQGLFSRREGRMAGRDFNLQQHSTSWRCCKCQPGSGKWEEKQRVVRRTVSMVGDIWRHFLNLAKNRQGEPFEFHRQTSFRQTFFFLW